MPTEKRARQRAGRYQKVVAEQRKLRNRRYARRGLSLFALAAVIVLVVVLISVGGSGSKKPKVAAGSSSTTTSTTTSTTQPFNTAAATPVCPSAHEAKRLVWFKKAPPDCIAKTSVWDATFRTSLGSFVVSMDAAKSYAAVNNFVFLTRWNYYNGTFFHRVIPGFVVQGGDPTGTGTGGPHAFPGYSFTGNTPPKSCTAAKSCYQPGDLALANSSGPSTDGSQFFVVLPGGQSTLDTEPSYTLFGKVTSGMPVVDKIGADGSSSGTPTVKVYLLSVTLKQVSS